MDATLADPNAEKIKPLKQDLGTVTTLLIAKYAARPDGLLQRKITGSR